MNGFRRLISTIDPQADGFFPSACCFLAARDMARRSWCCVGRVSLRFNSLVGWGYTAPDNRVPTCNRRWSSQPCNSPLPSPQRSR